MGKSWQNFLLLLLLAALGPGFFGCASPNVNPPQARAQTGYVDFHDPATNLCWEVARFDDRSQTFQRCFSDLTPPAGGVLRLACPPGKQRFRITFLNRVITQPAEAEVVVQDGLISPVGVALTAAGSAMVQTETKSLGGTARGRYGVRTKYGTEETTMYTIATVVQPPVAYQPKERMNYAP